MSLACAVVATGSPATQAQEPSSPEIRFATHWQPREGLPEQAIALPPIQAETVLPAAEAAIALEQLERTALANNPAVARAAAQVRAAQGATLQAGLAPNPTIGYQGNEIGNNGAAGQQGGMISQTFVTGGKLALAQAAKSQRVVERNQQLFAAQRRVLSDVRSGYYQAVAAQRRVRLAEQLVQIAEQAVSAATALLEALEVSRVDLLQSQIQMSTARIRLQKARNQHTAAWRQLMAVVGTPGASVEPLSDALELLPPELEWETTLAELLASSPEISAASARVDQAIWRLRREQAEPIPNLNLSGGVAKDDSTENTIANVQLQMPVPLWNRNQGGVRRAQGELAAARADVQRIELSLQQRLAAALQEYANARVSVEQYRAEILPAAKDSLDLVSLGYRQGEFGYLMLLTAQRTYYSAHLDYVDSLRQVHQSLAQIDNYLLSGSLDPPGRSVLPE